MQKSEDPRNPVGGSRGALFSRTASAVPLGAMRVLDVGCADGNAGAIMKQRAGREVWGVEKDVELASEASKRLDHVVPMAIEDVPGDQWPAGWFDCIVCGDVLEHLLGPSAALDKLRSWLGPHGVLVANVPNIGHWSVVSGLLFGRFDYTDCGLLDRTHVHFFTCDSFSQLLGSAGFVPIYVEPTIVANAEIVSALARAASALGVEPDEAAAQLNSYQYLFIARPAQGRPRVSIVVRLFNSAFCIHECLESVLPTLRESDEVILVDNGSKDDSLAIATQYEAACEAVRVIANGGNQGYSASANVGIRASTGEYVILLNPDIKVRPGWIEGLLARFKTDKIGAVGPVSNRVAGRQFVGHHLSSDVRSVAPDIANALVRGSLGADEETKLLIGICLAVPRRVLDHVGLLDEDLLLGSDDLELSWRLRQAGYTLVIAKDVYVEHGDGHGLASLPSHEAQKLLQQSTDALRSKLKNVYGERVPTSTELWGIEIFPSE